MIGSTTPLDPVFHDPHRGRWRRLRAAGYGLAAVLSIIVILAVASIVVDPTLPSIGLKPLSQLSGIHALAAVAPPPPLARTRRDIAYQRARAALAAATPPVQFQHGDLGAEPGDHSRLMAFYVNWDDASFESLKTNIRWIDTLVPEWLHVAGPSSHLSVDNAAQQATVMSFVHTARPSLQIVPLVNNYDQTTQAWDSANLARTLASPTGRATLIDALMAWVRANGFAGINIDFENLPPGARADLTAFMSEFHARFHPQGLIVSQSAPLNDPAFDYQALANSADYLILMAYDQHASTSEPGPVAAQDWFTAQLDARMAGLPAGKVIIGMGSYGYDWTAGKSTAVPITFSQAIATAHAASTTVSLDPTSLNPYFAYADAQNTPHHVWLLDAVTAFNEIAALDASHPAGYAVWRLGAEDPSMWRVLRSRDHLTASLAEALEPLDVQNGVAYRGSGEVLKLTGLPVNGGREVVFDPRLSLITSEKVDNYASPYIVTRWGASDPKMIALTFDDGPDPTWTPQIIDVLDTRNVPGTFFIIGMNGDTHPEILRRILDTGSEIGNHTFSHPDVSLISSQQLRLQLDATDRLLQSRLGIRSVLFRPPYAQDLEPTVASEVRPLRLAGEMGYVTVGMGVDPNDWARPGVDAIVSRTIAQIQAGKGQIVLLHDGGADRSQTVAALPRIISGLQSLGYRFVTVSQLVGLSRSAVMPSLPRDQVVIANASGAGFVLLDWLTTGMYWLFLTGVVLGIARVLVVGTLAVAHRVRDHRRRSAFSGDFRPSVSAIVPAYNEEKVVVRSIEALLASDYPDLEVIVVDDGSTDGTLQAVLDAYRDDPRVTALRTDNGGKARALNHGIEGAKGEIVIGMDADTLFLPDAIGKLVRHFEDERVGAVAGNAKVGNRVNLLTRWQALEYITNQNLDRRAFEVLDCISVVPGAIGAWRRDLVLRAGGFTDDTLAEDADLTLRVLRQGFRINYEDGAIALTEAPDTVRGLLKQRHRWVFGTLQAFWKNRGALLDRGSLGLSLAAIPNALIFQVFFPLVSPLVDLMVLVSAAGVWLQRVQHPGDVNTASFQHILFYYALFLVLDYLTAALAFSLEKSEDWRLLIWLYFQRFFYRQLMYYVVWKSVYGALKGVAVGWHHVERKATVRTAD